MSTDNIPKKPANSFRIALELYRAEKRLDTVLLQAIKQQNENLDLREISRTKFKELFNEGKIQIKGQNARPSSAIAKGTTYVDILGFKQK
jgi:exonuclease III